MAAAAAGLRSMLSAVKWLKQTIILKDSSFFSIFLGSPAVHPVSHSWRYRAAMIGTIFQWFAMAMVAGGFVALVTIIDVALIETFHRRR